MNKIYRIRFVLYGIIVGILTSTLKELINLDVKAVTSFIMTVIVAILLFPVIYILDKKYVSTDKEN